MLLKFRKRAVIALVVLSLICASLCVTIGVYERREVDFEPRFTEPDTDNAFYYGDNVFNESGFGIPNCTAYAWGRVYELLGEKPRLCTGNAESWFEYNKANGIYDYGLEPELGAVACFKNSSGGHVAVVEDIDNGVITFSNSAYMGREFYLTTASVDSLNPGQEGWSFQGYIYPASFTSKKLFINSNRRVSPLDGLNLRLHPSVGSEVLDTMPEKSEVFVTEVSRCGGYFWGKTTFGGKTGYCVIEYTESVF